MSDSGWNMLEKTELRIERIGLEHVNLTDVAATTAQVLGLRSDEVFVIDARDDLLTLDILRDRMDPDALVGRQPELFAALDRLPGIVVGPDTSLCSEGMLGWIAMDADEGRATLERSKAMLAEIEANIAARVMVFSTGPEVLSGQIEDTNKPWIAERLGQAGYKVTPGPDLPDDIDVIAATMRSAAEERGFGVLITTGGVGAESKDGTVEALESIDPDASTPVLFEVKQGHGRHVKSSVRIGLGRVSGALAVCLPGPHEEVQVGIEALLTGIADNLDDAALAERVAAALRARLRQRHQDHHAAH